MSVIWNCKCVCVGILTELSTKVTLGDSGFNGSSADEDKGIATCTDHGLLLTANVTVSS